MVRIHVYARSYVQGQINNRTNLREYFYMIDHQGNLFLDDTRIKNFTSCFKDVKFLRFFYSRIRATKSQDYVFDPITFPYVSDCGIERNFIKSTITPFVYTTLQDNSFTYNNTGLIKQFTPEHLYVASDGRLYHPFTHKHVDFALVKSSIAEVISGNFKYEHDVPKSYVDEKTNKSVELSNVIKEKVEALIAGGTR